MRLNELTPEDFVLRPPAQMLWVKRHYCPMFVSSIALSKRKHVDLDAFNKQRRSNFNDIVIGLRHRHIVQKAWGQWPSLMGDRLIIDEPFINIFANIEGTERMFKASCAIDDALYLLPYLFKAVPCEHYINGTLSGKGWVDQLIPERWDKLRKMNIIGKFDEVIYPLNNRSYSGGRLDVRLTP